MLPWMLKCFLLSLVWVAAECDLRDHRTFQYNSLVDRRGTYNFAYDTSHEPGDAHSLHMEYRDENGIVRGRYGYTDPRGTFRVVEYEAGPDGFKARGDVGPDLFPHMEAPGLAPQKPVPAPTPLRMAGWDPSTNPINQRVAKETDYYTTYTPSKKSPERSRVRYIGRKEVYRSEPSHVTVSKAADPDVVIFQQRLTTDTKKSPERSRVRYIDRKEVYRSEPPYGTVSKAADPDVVIFQQRLPTDTKKSKPIIRKEPLTIYNIDVDPDDIRVAGPPALLPSPQRTSAVVVSSPQLTYSEPAAKRRSQYIVRSDEVYPSRTASYGTYGQRIYRPRQIRYRPHYHPETRSRPQDHSQHYYFD